MKKTVIFSILEPEAGQARELLAAAPDRCGMVELRADLLDEATVRSLVRAATLPVIVTVRPTREGGRYEGSERDRITRLRAALEAGARFVDVEWGSEAAGDLLGSDRSRVILSDHGAPCERNGLLALHRRMSEAGAAVLKIVPTAGTAGETAAVHELLRNARSGRAPLIGFAQGRPGAVSRLLALCWGSAATYGAAYPGGGTAEGQYTASDLVAVHDVQEIGEGTRRFALIGSDLETSPSPAMHNTCYAEQGLDARYFPLETERLEEVDALVDPEGPFRLEGFGATLPFKEQAAERAEPGDRWCALAGAANTIRIEAGAWTGFNTDASAARRLVARCLDPRGLTALVIGAGGTARTFAAVLRDAGAEVILANRTAERAMEAARRLGVGTVAWEDRSRIDAGIVVQATPLGRKGERVIDPPPRCRLVIDAAYGPAASPLVRSARNAGCPAVDGLEFLVEQAVDQYAVLTGSRPSRETMHAAAWKRLERSGFA